MLGLRQRRLRDWVGPLALWSTYHFFGLRDRAGLGPKGPHLVDVDVHGFQMRLDTSLFFDYFISKYAHLYEPYEIVFTQEHLGPGDVYLDIGSNVGLYSLFASRQVGAGGRVVAIDADPAILPRLQHNLQVNGACNVQALNIGVTDARCTASFGVAKGSMQAASSFVAKDPDHTVQVECYPLLDVLHDQGIDHVTGMKLDIERLEYPVLARFLQDADEALWPGFIQVEFLKDTEREGGGNVVDLLQRHGYRIQQKTIMNHLMVRA